MAWYDHEFIEQPLALRGYQPFAPRSILDRALVHHRDLRLSEQQLHRLLEIKRDYGEYLASQVPTLVNNWTDLDEATMGLEVDEAAARALVRRRAELMAELEDYFVEVCKRIRAAISDEQHATLRKLYAEEKQRYMERVRGPLRHKFEGVEGIFD